MRVLIALAMALACAQAWSGFKGIPGDYCRTRRPEQCCHSRDDDCTVDILGNHKCYCDMFCHREDEEMHGDCCPDFEPVCLGQPIKKGPCKSGGHTWNVGDRATVNCKNCVCGQNGWEHCQPDAKCLIQEELLDMNQQGREPWNARNYSMFWGRTLADGVKYRLGTYYPEAVVQAMHGIIAPEVDSLPRDFDSRTKWPGLIGEPRDQGDCGASWVFSTVSLAEDRLAILSEGKLKDQLSAQQLLSCNRHRQGGCDGGYLDRAWWYIRRLGLVTEDCYPYQSGRSQDPGTCEIERQALDTTPRPVKWDNCPRNGRVRDSRVYRITPPYRLASKQEDIMAEIYTNGPVQATFKVHEDFFMYGDGVYRKMSGVMPANHNNTYHSVRIIGWGVDTSTGRDIPYWLCANSWGQEWGDRGLFKIVRGENHCEIESFVITALGQGAKKRRRRLMKKIKRQRVLKL